MNEYEALALLQKEGSLKKALDAHPAGHGDLDASHLIDAALRWLRENGYKYEIRDIADKCIRIDRRLSDIKCVEKEK